MCNAAAAFIGMMAGVLEAQKQQEIARLHSHKTTCEYESKAQSLIPPPKIYHPTLIDLEEVRSNMGLNPGIRYKFLIPGIDIRKEGDEAFLPASGWVKMLKGFGEVIPEGVTARRKISNEDNKKKATTTNGNTRGSDLTPTGLNKLAARGIQLRPTR